MVISVPEMSDVGLCISEIDENFDKKGRWMLLLGVDGMTLLEPGKSIIELSDVTSLRRRSSLGFMTRYYCLYSIFFISIGPLL